MPIISLNRELGWRTALLAMLLLWPLLLFGRPAYISDSVSYLKGGEVAVEFTLDKLFPDDRSPPANGSTPGPAAGTTGDAAVPEPQGVRSVYYSVAAYLLRWPGDFMHALVVAQALAAAFVCAVTALAFGAAGRREFAALSLILALATPLPFVTALTIPDVFAGLLIASSAILIARYRALSTGVKLILLAIATSAVTFHSSIPPLAAALALIAILLWWWRRRSSVRPPTAAVAVLFVPILLGGFLTAVSGLVAFGDASLAPKRYPLALARSVADGPARWYLEEECTQPRYAVCEIFGTDIPNTVSGFVFNDGLDGKATPEQMDRIRSEEGEIVLRAALRYPGTELGTLATNLLKQLAFFGNGVANFDQFVSDDGTGTPVLVQTTDDHSGFIRLAEAIIYLVAVISIGWIAIRFRSLSQESRNLILYVGAGILANAVICVVFSGVAERYQARVIWIAPLFAFCLWRASLADPARECGREAEQPAL